MTDILVFTGIVLAGALSCGIYAWPRVTGRRRSWVNCSGIGASAAGNYWMLKRNTMPFAVAALGVGWVLLWTAIWAEDHLPDWGALPWSVQIAAPLVVLWSVTFGWPSALTPAWYKDWLARGGRDDPHRTPPYPRCD